MPTFNIIQLQTEAQVKLDRTDRRILQVLQRDDRISNLELAEEIKSLRVKSEQVKNALTSATELLEEMNARVAAGISAVPNEQHRLLWDNLPIWYRTRWL